MIVELYTELTGLEMFQKNNHIVKSIVHFKWMLLMKFISWSLDTEYSFLLYKMIFHIAYITDLNKSLWSLTMLRHRCTIFPDS